MVRCRSCSRASNDAMILDKASKERTNGKAQAITRHCNHNTDTLFRTTARRRAVTNPCWVGKHARDDVAAPVSEDGYHAALWSFLLGPIHAFRRLDSRARRAERWCTRY